MAGRRTMELRAAVTIAYSFSYHACVDAIEYLKVHQEGCVITAMGGQTLGQALMAALLRSTDADLG